MKVCVAVTVGVSVGNAVAEAVDVGNTVTVGGLGVSVGVTVSLGWVKLGSKAIA